MTFGIIALRIWHNLRLMLCFLFLCRGWGPSLWAHKNVFNPNLSELIPHLTSPTINMSSPLADFITCLKQVKSLSIHVALVSDNAKIANQHVVGHNGYREPARPSRWEAEKSTQLSPKFPYRSIEHLEPMRLSRHSSTKWKPTLPPAKAA